jgi:hypothetical protein
MSFQQLFGYKKTPLKFFELLFLSLMFLSLPSLEAPKSIFLFLFLLFAIWNQYPIKAQHTFNKWDFIYFSLILTALLSALFAGLPSYEEWRGFRGIFTWALFGLVLARSSYNEKEISWLFLLIKTYKKVKINHLSQMLWGGSFSAFIVTFGTGLVNSTLHHEHALLAFIFLSLYLIYLKKNNQI